MRIVFLQSFDLRKLKKICEIFTTLLRKYNLLRELLMKLLFALMGISAAGFFGYQLEPQMRHSLTGKESFAPSEKPQAKDSVAPKDSSTEPSPAAEKPVAAPPTFDYSALQPSQLPEKVVLQSAASASAPGETDALALSVGTKVTPVRIEAETLVFRVLGAAEGKIPVEQTNLVELLIANPPPPPSSIPEAAVEPTPIEVPTPEPMPTPEPAPQPTVEIEAPAALSADDIIALMKKSLAQGQIKEFTVDQVTDWKAADDETIDGQTYQTGIASYKAETIFGTRNVSAKALVKEGSIVRWVSPTSGLEIE